MTWGSWSSRLVVLGTVLSVGLSLAGVPPSAHAAPSATAAASKLRPRGALYGRVRHGDGRPAPDADVGVYDQSDLDPLTEGILILASLGIFCFIPGVCGSHADAEVDNDGSWFVRSKDLPHPSEKAFQVIASLPAGDGELVAPTTSLYFANRRDPQRSRDVAFWQPPLRVSHHGTGFSVTWPRLTRLPHGREIDYAAYRQGTDPFAVDTLIGTVSTRNHVRIPDWQVEDQPFQVHVKALTRTSDVAYTYDTGTVDASRGPRPLSRGRRCLAQGKYGGRLRQTAGRGCALTDGDLEENTEVLLPGDEPNGVADHKRLCVDLGHVRRVGLVVVRTPFVNPDMFVETSNGRAFHTQGALSNVDFTQLDEDHGDAFPVFFDHPVRTRLVCVRDTEYGEGFEGAILNEISVWGPQQGMPH